mmetsp:Transcript_44063/g.106235  ORF Transcript_44063/g.106235 Transcript_44063/m.106235 type:complete len:80 (-) Transcript_44063:489-728(-)
MTTSIPLILSKDYTGQKIEIEIKEELVGHCQDSFILIGATSHRIESVSPLATPLVGRYHRRLFKNGNILARDGITELHE